MAKVMIEVSDSYASAIRAERKAWRAIHRAARKIALVAKPVWQEGDGEGGAVFDAIFDEFKNAGLTLPKSGFVRSQWKSGAFEKPDHHV